MGQQRSRVIYRLTVDILLRGHSTISDIFTLFNILTYVTDLVQLATSYVKVWQVFRRNHDLLKAGGAVNESCHVWLLSFGRELRCAVVPGMSALLRALAQYIRLQKAFPSGLLPWSLAVPAILHGSRVWDLLCLGPPTLRPIWLGWPCRELLLPPA